MSQVEKTTPVQTAPDKPDPRRMTEFEQLLDRDYISSPQVIEAVVQTKRHELRWRKAQSYAASTLVPSHFRNQPANVYLALELAERLSLSEMMVLQNAYVVSGRLGFQAQMIIAAINASKRFPSGVRYERVGVITDKTYRVRAYAIAADGERLDGPWLDWGMVSAEGWDAKKDRDGNFVPSKWNTIPALMFDYRAATWFGRIICPELLMGLQTAEELEDTTPTNPTNDDKPQRMSLKNLRNNSTGADAHGEPLTHAAPATHRQEPSAPTVLSEPTKGEPPASPVTGETGTPDTGKVSDAPVVDPTLQKQREAEALADLQRIADESNRRLAAAQAQQAQQVKAGRPGPAKEAAKDEMAAATPEQQAESYAFRPILDLRNEFKAARVRGGKVQKWAAEACKAEGIEFVDEASDEQVRAAAKRYKLLELA